MADFTKEELERYNRNILLKEIGTDGQHRLKDGKVLVVGAGGLGSPAIYYLAAAGIGTIGIVDSDNVDYTNLQRQILHTTADIGRAKVDSACERAAALNPNVRIVTYKTYLNASNVQEIIGGYDFIIDATDNFQSKYLINDACVAAGKPFSHGGIVHFEGQALTHLPGTACIRCIFGEGPKESDNVPTGGTVGILGAAAGTLGAIQATEAIKYIAQAGKLLTDSLFTIDLLNMEFHRLSVEKNPECPVCSHAAHRH